MRYAICIYGYLRSYQFTIYNFIKQLVKPYGCDVFIYCPNTTYAKLDDDIFHTKANPELVHPHRIKDDFGLYLKSIATWSYDKHIFIDKVKKDGVVKKNKFNQETWRSYSMFFHIKRVLEMMESYEMQMNIKYDKVILTRLDLFIYNKVKLKKLSNEIVYFPIGEGFDEENKRRFGAAPIDKTDKTLNDQFLIGNRDHIIKLKDIYDNIKDFVHKNKIELNNETLIGYQFIQNNIQFEPKDIILYKLYR